MEAFGYDKKDEECNRILALKEVSISCNKDELDNMIAFLKSVCDDIERTNAGDGEHWHYRDYNELWTKKESDFIVIFDKGSAEK